MVKRYLADYIVQDLNDRMVFIGGARQVGKTTLALYIAKNYFTNYSYLNWDSRDDRRDIMKSHLKADAEILIFDEIHKYKSWKNYIKGIYDKHKDRFKIIVTGSSRLDIYRKGGDSLMGRYRYYHLHPFSLAELSGNFTIPAVSNELLFPGDTENLRDAYMHVLKYGGFPEPLLAKKERTLRRWQNERLDRLVKEDIRDLHNIRDLSTLQLLVDILPEKVGSLLSLNSMREDLQVSHKTIAHWMEVLETFYYHFRIYPFHHLKIRSLKKEPKLYLWDWSGINEKGARFENLVASHLLKMCHFLFDNQGYKAQLNYLRDVDGREVDFLISIDNKPWLAVEVKTGSTSVAKNLHYYGARLKIPYIYQVVDIAGIDIIKDLVRVISADKFLSALM